MLWFKISDKIRFLIIGALNAFISYVIFLFAIYCLGDKYYQAAVLLQWVLSSFISYFNQKFFVFNTRGNYIKEYVKCCSTWAVSYVLNVIILEILVKYLTLNVFISQFISLLLVSVLTYVLFKYFAFNSDRH